ncbi:hypothetical protein ACWCQS_30525 [Streptomyces sp. NPDC002076]
MKLWVADWEQSVFAGGLMPHVRGYYRADGTWVSPHERGAPIGARITGEEDGSSIWYWIMGFTALTLLHVGLAVTAAPDYLMGAALFGAADVGALLIAKRIGAERRVLEAERFRQQSSQKDEAERARRELDAYVSDLAAAGAEHVRERIHDLEQWQTPDGRPGPYAPTVRPPRPTCPRCGTQKYGHPGSETCFWCGQ